MRTSLNTCRLVCVRYRYDALKRRLYTTAEIVVDESEWDPGGAVMSLRERVARTGLGIQAKSPVSNK
jgi:hypothetical protein